MTREDRGLDPIGIVDLSFDQATSDGTGIASDSEQAVVTIKTARNGYVAMIGGKQKGGSFSVSSQLSDPSRECLGYRGVSDEEIAEIQGAMNTFYRFSRQRDGDRWINVADAAEQLGCLARHVTDMIKRGTLAGTKRSNAWIVRVSDVDALVESRVAA